MLRTLAMPNALTARPAVPILVQAAIVGSLSTAGLGCGDDSGRSDTGNSTDVAPTAGPCVHADGSNLPECQTSGLDAATSMDTAMDMSTTGTATTNDVPPTAGPCAHADGSQLPECQATGTNGETTAADSDSDSSSGSSGTGTGSTTTG